MKWIKSWVAVLAGIAAAAAAAWFILDALEPPQPPVRALWVTRFDYTLPEDVSGIVGNAAAAGFTDLFFQIRGNATAYYRSELEPWAFELSGDQVELLGNDPGWDPLQRALDAARPHGLRVHAYINVLPGWKGLEEPPVEAGQLWTAHPEWFMIDSLGRKMLPTSGWYTFINPVLPEVRKHLRSIVNELCRYDIDGIHLDYIRYPYDYRLVAPQRYPDATEEEILRHADFSYDPASQAALFERYGWDVSRQEIREFRCDSITRVVREISMEMQLRKPDACLLSASVLGNPTDGRNHAYQDSAAWARQGLVDWVVQMNYGTASFDRYLAMMRKATGRRRFRSSVIVGINCKNDVDDILAQLDKTKASRCRGFALFSYSFLFDREHRITEKGREILPKLQPDT